LPSLKTGQKVARFFFLLFFPSMTVKCALLALLFLPLKDAGFAWTPCFGKVFPFVCCLFFDLFAALTKAFCSFLSGLALEKRRTINQMRSPTTTKESMFCINPTGLETTDDTKPIKASKQTIPITKKGIRFFKKKPPP